LHSWSPSNPKKPYLYGGLQQDVVFALSRKSALNSSQTSVAGDVVHLDSCCPLEVFSEDMKFLAAREPVAAFSIAET
jgi:hypothetical protein